MIVYVKASKRNIYVTKHLGEFLVPMELRGDPFCSDVFFNNTQACLKTFHEKFMADRSDTTLCE